MVVPLRLTRCERRRLWTMFGEQRQAFNFGVAATLQALERDGQAGSRFDVWRTLTTARHSGVVAAGVPLMCQRAGVAAGRAAVKLWQDAIETNMGKAAFWAARRDLCRTRTTDTAQLAALIDKHGRMFEDSVVVELMDRLRVRIADAEDAAAKVTHRTAGVLRGGRHRQRRAGQRARFRRRRQRDGHRHQRHLGPHRGLQPLRFAAVSGGVGGARLRVRDRAHRADAPFARP